MSACCRQKAEESAPRAEPGHKAVRGQRPGPSGRTLKRPNMFAPSKELHWFAQLEDVQAAREKHKQNIGDLRKAIGEDIRNLIEQEKEQEEGVDREALREETGKKIEAHAIKMIEEQSRFHKQLAEMLEAHKDEAAKHLAQKMRERIHIAQKMRERGSRRRMKNKLKRQGETPQDHEAEEAK